MRPDRLSALLLPLALTACSSEPQGGGRASSGAGGASTSSTSASSGGASGGAGGAAPACKGPGYAAPRPPQVVDSVEATVVDLQGAPLAMTPIQVCGTNLCLNATTTANGHVLVQAGGKKLTKPAIKFADGLVYNRFALPLPDQPVVSFPSPLVAAKLPDLAQGQELAPGKVITSGEVTLTIQAGADVQVDTLNYDAPEKQRFRAVAVPIDKVPPALIANLKLVQIYGAAPLETLFCPPAAVKVPNSARLPAGAAVEFLVHGLDIGEDYAPYGGWAKVSEGRVSDDGATISTAPDGGLPVLAPFGVRLK